jgi:Tfp pilus assembly protein PilV
MKSISSNATSRHGSLLSHPSCRRSAQAQDSRASNFHHQKSEIQNLKFGESAFSLTEVVIAMGVAAVAFTSIIALFPLGLNMSKESYEATQAALIAQTILADLKDALNTGSGRNQALKLIPKTGNTETFDSANYTTIDLYNNSSQTFYLAYDQKPRSGAAGSPIILRPCAFSTSPGDFYTEGATNGANVIVRVIVEKTLVLGASGRSNPQKIEVSVETPGNSKNTNRVQYVFTGVINQS